nr:RNA-directed DNA polymerase, eukaryota [Tanacetum cinerariifolium]
MWQRKDKIDKLERQILDGKLMFMDDDGNPLVHTGNVDSDSEVEVVFDETANLMALTSFKDEALFFEKRSLSDAQNLIRIFKCFKDISRLSINIEKSRLYGIGIDPREA